MPPPALTLAIGRFGYLTQINDTSIFGEGILVDASRSIFLETAAESADGSPEECIMTTTYRIRRTLIVALALTCISLEASAGKAGSEFRVNTTTVQSQALPSVTGLADGSFVVTWWSWQDGSKTGVYGQRFKAGGRPVKGEFPVNTYTLNDQNDPAVAMLTGGGFVVVWASDGQDGYSLGIYGQRYRANGSPAGSEFRINTYTAAIEKEPSVAGLADGGFVVT